MSDPLAPLREIAKALGATVEPILLGDPVPIGAEIDVDEIGCTLDRKTFIYRGRAIVIYIKDHRHEAGPKFRIDGMKMGYRSPEQWLGDHPEMGKKYHLGECRTIESMIKEKRIERYVNGGSSVRRRNDDGYPIFPIEFDRVDQEIALHICKNCIDNPYIVGISRSGLKGDIRNFDLEGCLQEKSASLRPDDQQFPFRPQFTALTAPRNEYPADWSSISWDYRRRRGWKCESCGGSFKCHKKLLHTHHKNMQKGDNRKSNLEALCINCHRQRHPGNRYLQAENENRAKELDEHEAKCDRPQSAN